MTLKLIEISGGYGQRLVHENISIDAASGEVIAIIGRNGTGKTTLAKLIAGELPLESGQIRLDGEEISLMRQWQRAKNGIAYMPQTEMVFDKLTVAENLALNLNGEGFSSISAQNESSRRINVWWRKEAVRFHSDNYFWREGAAVR